MTPEPQPTITDNIELLALLDALRSVILYFDRWGTVIHGNRRACQWRPLEQLVGRTFVELAQHWHQPEQTQREMMQVVRTGIPSWGVKERSGKGADCRWFSVDKIPTLNKLGEVTGVMLVINDISESVVKERALEESDARYKAFIANSADAIWCYEVYPPVDTTLSPQLQVEQILKRAILVECNETLARFFGVTHTRDVIGLPLSRSGSLSSYQDVRAFIDNGYRLENKEFSRVDRTGMCGYMQSSAIGVVENGLLMRAWGITRDITDQRTHTDRMEYLANHDSLTLLPNRTLLYSTMEQTIANAKNDQLMALMIIDLDRFKEINDTLGHRAGDSVLQQVGPRLEGEMVELEGLVARLGGDEFAVFLPRVRNAHQALVLGHRFIDSLGEPFEIETFRTEVTASIGISMFPDQGRDVSTLMRYADVAMYHAKRALKGVAVYDPEFDPHSPTRLEIMGALRRAIRESQLELYFQPKIDLLTHRVTGFEGLLRWHHPEIGTVPPVDFIPIVEKSNLIYPLTCWVMAESIRQCAIWRREGHDITVAMNLSASNVTDERLLAELRQLLTQYDLPGHCLEMELTESTIMNDPERALTALKKIAALGVHLSIDDFGTGYSSLAYLKRLPVGTLKIDKSFVMDMLIDEQDEIIVNSTINLAHNLGLSVVAEGVESQEIYQRLQDHKCDSAQGFLIARPMPAADATRWLLNSQWSGGLP
ncbi:sensor domain-containing protein [Teredinibacter turnerae]|uniref:cyclic-guanylate-specific phosphodiesterase n=1 Tax=Teredinibacter turnerae (strain ATCC 39867 / T7901) TaxID=377629 RepID=C5BQV7_TERTT|nr:EAL domain-containing protein [Teredinibacter turnerae]ACR13079.1 eal and ggdef domain containing protein [Teredinibacter turnerae T7901]